MVFLGPPWNGGQESARGPERLPGERPTCPSAAAKLSRTLAFIEDRTAPLATARQGQENIVVSESSALFMPTVVVGAVYAFYLLIAAREAASRKRRQAMLSAAWAAMGSSAADVEAGTVTGVVRGLPTAFC